MTKTGDLISSEKQQLFALIALSAGSLGLTAAFYFSNSLLFRRFIGGINPLLAGSSLVLAGIVLLSFLLSKGWFAVYKRANLKGMLRLSGLAALLALVMIAFDTKVVFPADINIPFPGSLLFYPAIGYFAEILFHLLPLSVLLVVLPYAFKNIDREKLVWVCILLVSLAEPVYQTVAGYSSPYPSWVMAYVAFHVFMISLCQLWIFKRYDFVSMYFFRLVYYLFWHIAWGYLRLKILF